MNEKEFFDVAYHEYQTELALACSLHQRAGVLLTAYVIVGAAAASISRVDLLPRIADRWDIGMALMTTALVALFLLSGIACLFVMVCPRDYPKLSKMFFWCQWREKYRQQLAKDDPEDDERNRTALAEATLQSMLERVADAQSTAAYFNQKRLRAFYWSTFCLALAVVGLCLQGAFALLLKVEGV